MRDCKGDWSFNAKTGGVTAVFVSFPEYLVAVKYDHDQLLDVFQIEKPGVVRPKREPGDSFVVRAYV